MKLALATSFDENYIDYMPVMVQSISENYHGKEVLDFYCLVPEELLVKETQFRLNLNVTNMNIKFVTSENYKKFLNNGFANASIWVTQNAWHRMFISSLLKDYDKCIYLDADTMVCRDIDPLLNYPMYSKFMAYQEIWTESKAFETNDRIYFNDGVFITDLNYWRDNDLENKMVDYVIKNGSTEYIEQDILNRFMVDEFYPLPMSFNFFAWQFRFLPFIYEIMKDPLVVHFNGPEKPWKKEADIYGVWTERWRSLYNRLTGINIKMEEE